MQPNLIDTEMLIVDVMHPILGLLRLDNGIVREWVLRESLVVSLGRSGGILRRVPGLPDPR